MKKRRTHTFTITVTAPIGFTKSEIRREIRTNIKDHSTWLDGKHDRNGDWIELAEDAIKVRSIT